MLQRQEEQGRGVWGSSGVLLELKICSQELSPSQGEDGTWRKRGKSVFSGVVIPPEQPWERVGGSGVTHWSGFGSDTLPGPD